MDFFSSQHGCQSTSAVSPSVDPFAQEIGRRFALPVGQPLLTARLSPLATTVPVVPSPPIRLGNLSLKSKPPSPIPSSSTLLDLRLTTVVPSALLQVLNSKGLLVLDIRPHATFSLSRLPHALPLSVPSTLLKRPAFSLEKLTEMLPSASGRRLFSSWKSASRILVYDAESQSIPDGSNIRGLLRKFDNEGFCGDLLWLKGGFAAVWLECRSLVDDGPPSPDLSEEEDSCSDYLRTKKLPSSAFQQVSTTTASQRPPVRPAPVHPHHQVAPAPTFTRPVAANPFYDNIRQIRELEHGITERIPLRLSPSVVARRDDLPFDWLKEIVDKADAEEGAEALAMQFYLIELREQRRLMGVMDHHSREAGAVSVGAFPYSITAGVEKGSKNRYTNIWPFEHARVRLKACSLDDGSDYINASHVQPIGTDRRYIATQGPLPTTYTDFWTLCWEQHVSIIVMLTKEVEGTLVKCGSYWTNTSYGALRLHLVSSSHDHIETTKPHAPSGFDFGSVSDSPPKKATVRRCFLLSHAKHPEEPPRKITQLQYLAWPDYDVPENPRELLDLIREVDVLRSEAESQGPVLLHCSAGIGRTGGFIVMDAALDGIRREMRKCGMGKASSDNATVASGSSPQRDVSHTASPSYMDVDASDADTPLHPPLRQLSSLPQTRDKSPVHHPRPRAITLQHGCHNSSDGTDTSSRRASENTLRHPLSPRPSVPGTTSGSLTGSVLRPSPFAADADLSKRAKPLPKLCFFAESEPASPVMRFRAGLTPGSGTATPPLPRTGDSSPSITTTTTTNAPSIFSLARPATDKSTMASSLPVSVESSRSPSPTKDAEKPQANTSTFDYTDPRRLHDPAIPEPLSSFTEPVRKMLEDMREQRMSLCQSLRQYVFVHRAIVEGALDIVDEERAAQAQTGDKRGPSPTELRMEDTTGAVRLSKRPSMERNGRGSSLVNATANC